MKIDNKLITELEELSMFSLTADEREKAKKDIGDIINYFDTIKELKLDSENIPEESSASLREDIPCAGIGRDRILSGSRESENGFFKVPGIIRKEKEDETV